MVDKIMGLIPFFAMSTDGKGGPKLNTARVLEIIITLCTVLYGIHLSVSKLEIKMDSIGKQVTDLREDVVFYKAVNTENIKLNYKVKDQTVVEVSFEALVDESYGNGRLLGHIGGLHIS